MSGVNAIDQFLGRHFGWRPSGLIPITAQNPLSSGNALRPFGNAPGKFLRAADVMQLNIFKLGPAR